jgi:gamma-glutamyl:cysteine ligase YbdK (ATP-grasp superfamily)
MSIRHMMEQDDLKDSLHDLAKRCRIIAHGSYPKDAVAKASKLLDEWFSLQTQPKSPKEKQEREAQVQKLTKRMAAFLVTI